MGSQPVKYSYSGSVIPAAGGGPAGANSVGPHQSDVTSPTWAVRKYVYRRVTALLRQDGWPIGLRLMKWWRQDEDIRVQPTRRKVARRGFSAGSPTQALNPGHVWTCDFIADSTLPGGALRILTFLDVNLCSPPLQALT